MSNGNESSEYLIADYIKKELSAYGIVEWENGEIVYEGSRHNYLIEVKVHTLDKVVRLSEN